MLSTVVKRTAIREIENRVLDFNYAPAVFEELSLDGKCFVVRVDVPNKEAILHSCES